MAYSRCFLEVRKWIIKDIMQTDQGPVTEPPRISHEKPKKQRQLRVAPKKNSRHCHTNNANLLHRSLRRAKVSFRDGLQIQIEISVFISSSG
jgi:hypothetical protein